MRLPFIFLLVLGLTHAPPEQFIFLDDVGANPELLSDFIKIFDPYDTQVLYFVIPSRLDPETAELLSGRDIGIHGYEHFCGEFNTSYENACFLLEKGMSDFRAFDLTPNYFRPPCDIISPEARRAVDDLDLIFISGAPDYLFSCRECSLEKEIAKVQVWLGGNISFHQDAFLTPDKRIDHSKLEVMEEILAFSKDRKS